jgi:hypothetical protein
MACSVQNKDSIMQVYVKHNFYLQKSNFTHDKNLLKFGFFTKS